MKTRMFAGRMLILSVAAVVALIGLRDAVEAGGRAVFWFRVGAWTCVGVSVVAALVFRRLYGEEPYFPRLSARKRLARGLPVILLAPLLGIRVADMSPNSQALVIGGLVAFLAVASLTWPDRLLAGSLPRKRTRDPR